MIEKKTQSIFFKKELSSPTTFTKTSVVLEFGKNKRGEDYRNVNQIDTSNSTIAEYADKFENGLLSVEEMIIVIESQGYKKTGGRKKLPFAEKKKQIYILVKQKHTLKAQKQINQIEKQYNELP